LFLRDRGPTEVGGFGISAAHDLLTINDISLVGQSCTGATVRLEDHAVADYFETQVDRGIPPDRFARVWMHTHPGRSAEPSATDEDTFSRCFGTADWALMFILARRGQTYARIKFTAGPGGSLRIPVAIDFSRPFPAADLSGWQEEYRRSVRLDLIGTEAQPHSGVPEGGSLLAPWSADLGTLGNGGS